MQEGGGQQKVEWEEGGGDVRGGARGVEVVCFGGGVSGWVGGVLFAFLLFCFFAFFLGGGEKKDRRRGRVAG